MGMFDWVDIKIPCPKCGKDVEGFQSKDKDCNLDCLEFWEVDNFYSYCDYCGIMVDYHLKDEIKNKIKKLVEDVRKDLTVNDYELKLLDNHTISKEIYKRLEESDYTEENIMRHIRELEGKEGKVRKSD